MTYTISKAVVLAGSITLVRQGCWSASLEVASSDEYPQIGERTTLTIADASNTTVVTLSCTPILNALSAFGRNTITVVGGGATMGTPCSAHNDATGLAYGAIIDHIMAYAKGDVVKGIPEGYATTWQINDGTSVGVQLTRFLNSLNAVWRISDDGNVTIANDPQLPALYPAATLPKASQLQSADSTGTQVYAVQSFDSAGIVRPGQSLNGHNIEEVSIDFDAQSTLLTARTQSLRNTLRTLNEFATQSISLVGSWPAEIVAQSGDLLDVNADDVRFKGTGQARLPMTLGLPGCTVSVTKGTRCSFRYDGGDPGQPRIDGFEAGDGGGDLLITIGVMSEAQYVAQSNKTNQNFADLKTYLTNHNHNTGVGPSSPPIQPPPEPADTACSRLKVS